MPASAGSQRSPTRSTDCGRRRTDWPRPWRFCAMNAACCPEMAALSPDAGSPRGSLGAGARRRGPAAGDRRAKLKRWFWCASFAGEYESCPRSRSRSATRLPCGLACRPGPAAGGRGVQLGRIAMASVTVRRKASTKRRSHSRWRTILGTSTLQRRSPRRSSRAGRSMTTTSFRRVPH